MDLQPRESDVASRLPLPLPFQEDGGQVANSSRSGRRIMPSARMPATRPCLGSGEELCKEEQAWASSG